MKTRETKSIRYLGVIIDSQLNWIDHITYVKNKVAKGIGIIRKARKLLNKKALLNSLAQSGCYRVPSPFHNKSRDTPPHHFTPPPPHPFSCLTADDPPVL